MAAPALQPPVAVSAEEFVKSILYPARELRPDEISFMRNQAMNMALDMAVPDLGAKSSLAVREALPKSDFSLTYEQWKTGALTPNDWTSYLSLQVPTTKAVVFWGLYNRDLNPVTTSIRYRSGSSGAGGSKLILNMECLYGEEQFAGYHAPVFYKPGETIYIDVYGVQAVTQLLGFRCYVVERASENLSAGRSR